jgi:hypothetical protein
VRFRSSVIDVRAQRVQRKLALQIPFAARNFGAVQAARYAHLDALAAEAQRRIHGFTHRPAESHALLELQGDRFRHQLRIQLRLVYFLNVDENLALGALGQIQLQLLDLRALASDDDAGPRGADGYPQLVAGAIHFDRADAGRLQPLPQRLAQLHIFLQQLRVVLLGEPAGTPRLVKAQPETVRMNLLSHLVTLSPHARPSRTP